MPHRRPESRLAPGLRFLARGVTIKIWQTSVGLLLSVVLGPLSIAPAAETAANSDWKPGQKGVDGELVTIVVHIGDRCSRPDRQSAFVFSKRVM